MPKNEDSEEDRRSKIFQLENIVNDHFENLQFQNRNKNNFDEMISNLKSNCFDDLRKTFAIKK